MPDSVNANQVPFQREQDPISANAGGKIFSFFPFQLRRMSC